MVLSYLTGGPENLPNNDGVMETGHMGDCVSVIVLWNLHGIQYGNVRGWHGLGGIEAIDFAQLFQGVPDDILTQVIILASTMGGTQYLLGNVNDRGVHHLPAANIRVCKGFANAAVDRSGQVTRL